VTLQPGAEKAHGDLINICKYLIWQGEREIKKSEPDVSQWYPVKGKRQRTQTKIEKVPFKYKEKKFLT